MTDTTTAPYEPLGHGWRGYPHHAVWIEPAARSGARDVIRISLGKRDGQPAVLLLETGTLPVDDYPEDIDDSTDLGIGSVITELPLATAGRAMFDILAGFFLDDPGALLPRN
jgi:hypothetical protein